MEIILSSCSRKISLGLFINSPVEVAGTYITYCYSLIDSLTFNKLLNVSRRWPVR